MERESDRLMTDIYYRVRKYPGWLAGLMLTKLFEPGELIFVEKLDDLTLPMWNELDKLEFPDERTEADYKNVLQTLNDDIFDYEAQYDELAKADWMPVERLLMAKTIDRMKKERDRVAMKLHVRDNAKSGGGWRVDNVRIARAKNVPIHRIMGVPDGTRMKCPIHEGDNKTSFSIRGSWGHCFSCGKSLNSINYLMQIRGMNFVDAVRELEGML